MNVCTCVRMCVCVYAQQRAGSARRIQTEYQKFVRSDADVAAVFVVVFFTSLWYLLFATTTLPALWAVLLLHVRVVRLLWRIRAVIVLSSIT